MKRAFRVFAVLAALALALVAVPASAEQEAQDSSTYLALGDSYAFGYNPLVSPANPANFPGYTDSVAATLEVQLTNASCPGESSLSMITGSRLDDNGCQFYRAHFPLHTTYSGPQLMFAVHYLQTHRHTLLSLIHI